MAEYELSFEELRLQVMGLYTCRTCPTDIEPEDEVQEVVADLNVDHVGCSGGDLDLELQGNSREDPRKRILDQSSETDATEDESTSGSEQDISPSTSKLCSCLRRGRFAFDSKDDPLKTELGRSCQGKATTNFGCPDNIFLYNPKGHVFPRPRVDSLGNDLDELREDLMRRIQEQNRIKKMKWIFNDIELTDHFRERLRERDIDPSDFHDCIVHGTKERDGSNWRFSRNGVSVITDKFVGVAITIFCVDNCAWM